MLIDGLVKLLQLDQCFEIKGRGDKLEIGAMTSKFVGGLMPVDDVSWVGNKPLCSG